jgi:hypothetical protein
MRLPFDLAGEVLERRLVVAGKREDRLVADAPLAFLGSRDVLVANSDRSSGFGLGDAGLVAQHSQGAAESLEIWVNAHAGCAGYLWEGAAGESG